ncbi:hypothetical protein [Planobispora takensis]|uniref:Uncharacterized protein n=1 Tax=Planobispora takensis TaxID=1367882 RepID=A0A8J3SZA1_9ACTN|nr:hypothetical protein [Planobispora takensis]GII01546.1 hypothetical protein Pta02_35540 [Planobispora takensis]
MPEQSQQSDVALKFEQASAELVIQDVSRPGLPQQLMDVVTQASISSFTGRIAFAGQNSSGNHSVQFNDENANTGYSSTWPQWAFELAKAALLGNKRVWVLSNGSPFGNNLVSVLILA